NHTSLFVLVSGNAIAVAPNTATPRPVDTPTQTRTPSPTPTFTSTFTPTPSPSPTPRTVPFVTATITVGAGPYGIALNQTTNRIYVANNGVEFPPRSTASTSLTARPNLVSTIDGDTGAVIS